MGAAFLPGRSLGSLSIEFVTREQAHQVAAKLLKRALPTNRGIKGFYQIGLYDLDLRIEGGDEPEQSLTLRKAGWKQVRQPAVIQ